MKDYVSWASPNTEPFLYYLPDILTRPHFEKINLDSLLTFVQHARNETDIMKDALKILNSMVVPNEGHLLPPSPDMFYNNTHFLWKELGSHTESIDAIMHIINKTLFSLSLENIH